MDRTAAARARSLPGHACAAQPHAHGYRHANQHAYAHSHADNDIYADSNAHGHRYHHAYADCHAHLYGHAHRIAYPPVLDAAPGDRHAGVYSFATKKRRASVRLV